MNRMYYRFFDMKYHLQKYNFPTLMRCEVSYKLFSYQQLFSKFYSLFLD